MNRKMVCMIERRILFFAGTLIFVLFAAWFISGKMDSSEVHALEEVNNYKYYTSIQIQQGDSLWSIAGDYMSADYSDIDEYISEVKQLNHLKSDAIHAGEYLLIPYYSSQYL